MINVQKIMQNKHFQRAFLVIFGVVVVVLVGLYTLDGNLGVLTQIFSPGDKRGFAPVDRSSGSSENIEQLTLGLLKALDAFQKIGLDEGGKSLENLQRIVEERKIQMELLAENDPTGFLRNVLPESIRDKIPAELKNNIESEFTMQGILSVLHSDDFVNQENSKMYYFLESNGESLTLTSPSDFGSLVSNTAVSVRGIKLGKFLVVPNVSENIFVNEENALSNSKPLVTNLLGIKEANAYKQNSIGDQKTAVILVNFQNNQSQPWTKDFIRGAYFNNPDSINAYYQENSYSKTKLSGDVFGWYTMPINETCDWRVLQDKAIKASDKDIYFPNYSRVVVVYPDMTLCNFNAGSVGQWTLQTSDGSVVASISWVEESKQYSAGAYGTFIPFAAAHEYAHNLGARHARALDCGAEILKDNCSVIEYDDYFSVLGRWPWGNYTFHLGAPHKELLGWLSSSQIKVISTSGTYNIEPIETNTGGVKVIKIPRERDSSGNPTKWYFLEYRSKVGFDSNLPDQSAYQGVLVHYSSSSLPALYSYLLDMTPNSRTSSDHIDAALKINSTFTDSISGISFSPISQLVGDGASKQPPATMDVSINLPATACVRSNPSITVSPSSNWGKSGDVLQYNVVITNNDNNLCSAATLNLSKTIPSGWSSNFNASSFNLKPGVTGSTILSITSPTAATDGFYDVTATVTNSSYPTYKNSASATYVVSSYVADTTSPTATITSPTNGSVVMRNSSVTISANAADNVGVESVRFYVNSSLICTDNTAPYSCSWKVPKKSNATYNIQAEAKDVAGNIGSSAAIKVSAK